MTPEEYSVDAGSSAPAGPADDGPAVGGTVRMPDGAPVAGAAVTIAEPETGRQVSAAGTGPSGSYQIALPGAGTYLVIVSAAGRRPAADLVAVAGGPARHDVVLGGSGVLAGVARTAGTGDPVRGVVVTLTDSRGQVVAAGRVAADGSYRLDGLEPGDYTLTGAAPGVSPVARAVTVPGTEDLVFPAPAYRVAAVVTGPDGAPFAGAVVTLSGSSGTVATAVSDGQGAVAFEDIPAGSYTLAAQGSAPGVMVARAEPGRVARADIRLGAPDDPGGEEPDSWFLPEAGFSSAVR
ncbi:MAG TPA: carboxypeptidase-like regulatory domain-containing protein [Trebonia sp.]|nr:carboxypeptidase-like regulatory domain-containing protein [Trebonia sp.]